MPDTEAGAEAQAGKPAATHRSARCLGLHEPPADVTSSSHLHLLRAQRQRMPVPHTMSPRGCPWFPDSLALACLRIPWLLSSISALRPGLGHASVPCVAAAGPAPLSRPAALTRRHSLEAHGRQTLICYRPGDCESQVEAPADALSAVDPLPASRVAVCSLRPHVGKGARGPSVASFPRALTPFARPVPSRPTPLPKAPRAVPPWGDRT